METYTRTLADELKLKAKECRAIAALIDARGYELIYAKDQSTAWKMKGLQLDKLAERAMTQPGEQGEM